MPKGRRRLFPMPVEAMFDHPAWITLPAAGRGMLMSLCEHFWRSACAPLPRDDDQLFALARAHRPSWRHHKATILTVFEEIRPTLAAYHHKRQSGHDGLRIAASRGGATASARRNLAQLTQPPPAPDLATLTIPNTRSAQPPRTQPERAPRRVMSDTARR